MFSVTDDHRAKVARNNNLQGIGTFRRPQKVGKIAGSKYPGSHQDNRQ